MKEQNCKDRLDGLVTVALSGIEDERANGFAVVDTTDAVISGRTDKKIRRTIKRYFGNKRESRERKRSRRMIIVLAAAVVLTAVLCISVGAIRNGGLLFDLGKATREANDGEARIAATYKDKVIYYGEVEIQRAANTTRNEKAAARYATDYDIVNRLIEEYIMLEEAETRGMAVTDAEIADFVGSSRAAYEMPGGKEMIDDYCAGMNITVDEYFVMLESKAEEVMLHQLAKDAVGREYCEKRGMEFTKVNAPEEMLDYIDGYFEAKRRENEQYIVYYVDKK